MQSIEGGDKPNANKNKWRGQRWSLVVHGQRDADYQKLVTFFNTDAVTCAVIAKEFGKYKIHPHWQCYYELAERTLTAKSDITTVIGHEGFHIEKARGTKTENVAYVFGVNKTYEGGFVEYRKAVVTPRNYDPRPAKFWNEFVPRPFQRQLIDIVTLPVGETPCDDRSIYWIYEPVGNTGKTKLAEYLHIFHGAIVTGGTSSDMKHAVSRWQEIVNGNPTIIIADLARSDAITADAIRGLEAIKNGLFFDGKYESAMAHSFTKPHVLIFSNESPARVVGSFSSDRWVVY